MVFCNKILVVDDEQGIRDVLSELLSRRGYQVLTASRGEEALGIIKQSFPAAVILDYLMPGMDGLEILSKIKKDYPDVLVAILTGAGSEYIAVRAMKLGADNYICKPIEKGKLYKIIDELVEQFKQQLVWRNHEYKYPIEDEVIRRYEFLRKVYDSKKPNINRICKYFGYFRQDFYILNKKFKEGKVLALFNKSIEYLEKELGTGEELGVSVQKNPVSARGKAGGNKTGKRNEYTLFEFINREDPIQMRLEMIRDAAVTLNPNISMICKKYGVTREAFYQNYHRFEKFGVLGLIDRKRGRPSGSSRKG